MLLIYCICLPGEDVSIVCILFVCLFVCLFV